MDDLKNTSELEEFRKVSLFRPPGAVSSQIKQRIRSSLCLEPWVVFFKLCLSGVAGGGASLFICPQFENEHGYENALSRLYEGFGHYGCMMACGATFLGVSTVVALLILNAGELRLMRRRQFLLIPAAAFLFLSCFVCSGAEVMLDTGLFWLLGGALAGLCTLNAGWFIRRRLRPLHVTD